MVAQCAVIAIIIGLIIVTFLKSKRKSWAISTAPIAILPALHCCAAELLNLIGIEYTFQIAATDIIIGLVASCIGIGICTVSIMKKKKARVWYLITTILFDIALALILINHYYTAIK